MLPRPRSVARAKLVRRGTVGRGLSGMESPKSPLLLSILCSEVGNDTAPISPQPTPRRSIFS